MPVDIDLLASVVFAVYADSFESLYEQLWVYAVGIFFLSFVCFWGFFPPVNRNN